MRRLALAATLLLALPVEVESAAGALEAPLPTADQVKAAYLHKFAGYVDWPPDLFDAPDSPFVVGVAGADTVHAELERIALGRPVQGRAVHVRQLERTEQAVGAHVVFVGKELGAGVRRWLTALAARPVLTVSETPDGLEMGAVLNFVESGNRVRFEAAPGSAERAGIKLSSRLLAVAERVSGDPE